MTVFVQERSVARSIGPYATDILRQQSILPIIGSSLEKNPRQQCS
jgi:hypothetical protein